MNTPTQDVKQFVKIIDEYENGRSLREKFRDFVTLAYNAIAKTMAPDQEAADKHEAEYMRIVNDYRDKRAIRAYPEALALVQIHAAHYYDFLGHAAGEVGALSGDMGQFFTPMEVSRLLARMTTGDEIDAHIAQHGYVKMGEPAVGAGGMVLALAQSLAYRGHDPSTTLLVQARDLSPVAYEMCYIQLASAGIPALVIHGNTISLEHFRHAMTPACVSFYQTHGHLDLSYENPNFTKRHGGSPHIYPPLTVPKPRTAQPPTAAPTPELPAPQPEPTQYKEEADASPEQLRLF
jgi:hypothetical protein